MANLGCFSYSAWDTYLRYWRLVAGSKSEDTTLPSSNWPISKSPVEAAGIRHVSIGEDELPAGSLARELEDLSTLQGAAAFERVIASVTRECILVLRDAPELIRKHEIDFMLVDECCDAAATVARTRGIPFVSLALALTRYDEPTIPYWACPLPYSRDPEIIAQYKVWSDIVSVAAAPFA